MKKEINKYSWDYLTTEQYFDIADICEDKSIDDEIIRNARMVAIIEDTDEDTVMSENYEETIRKFAKLNFLLDFKIIDNYSPKAITIGNTKYNVVNDFSKIQTNQFADAKCFIVKPFREIYDKLLSVFVVPDGHKYNDGYDIKVVQEDIKKLSFRQVQSLINFILRVYAKYVNSSLQYIRQATKKKIKKEKSRYRKEIMRIEYNNLVETTRKLMATTFSV